jgi:histidinol-phosphate aminotransferase
VSGVAEAAAVAALGVTDDVQERATEVAAERDRVLAAARELGWNLPDSAANFIWIRLEDDLREALVDAFNEAEILVRGYAGDGVRITIASREANDRVLAVLAEQASLAG